MTQRDLLQLAQSIKIWRAGADRNGGIRESYPGVYGSGIPVLDTMPAIDIHGLETSE